MNFGFSRPSASAKERITYEDVLRARDRLKVLKTRAAKSSLRLLWLLAGPGVLVMLGENDGPSMVSYATTGATYGIGFFAPFILLTFLMAFVVQEMTVRLGVATHRGHAELIFQRFGPFWGYFAMGDLVFGNLLTLVTEFIAIQAGGLYFGVPSWALGRDRRGARRRLAGLSALRDLGARADGAGRVQPAVRSRGLARASGRRRAGPCARHLGAAAGRLHHGVPDADPRQYRRDRDAVDDLLPAERGRRQGLDPRGRAARPDGYRDRRGLGRRGGDRDAGGGRAAVRRARSTCRSSPTAPISPRRCVPLIGTTGATLFALGIVEAGLVAAMTISTSSSYSLAETVSAAEKASARHSLNLDFAHGRLFYGVAIVSTLLAAGIVLIPGAPLLAMTLTVNVIATLLMAPALLLLLLLANDREIMGDLANGRWANLAGGTIVVAIAVVGALYGVITVFPNLLPK